MLRHHHHPETVGDRIDQLMIAVFIADDRERIPQLAQHLSPDFVYISPSAVVEGAEGLSDAFSHYRQHTRRRATLRRTSDIDIHHNHFRFDWARSGGEDADTEGVAFGQLNAEGKIGRLVSFDHLRPGPRS